jgi:predicted RNA methylase
VSAVEHETTRLIEAAGFRWWIREGTSDYSSISEVAERRAYFTGYFKPEPGEHWLDAGANIGAFAVVAAAAGAQVTSYEPAPDNAELARRNLAA